MFSALGESEDSRYAILHVSGHQVSGGGRVDGVHEVLVILRIDGDGPWVSVMEWARRSWDMSERRLVRKRNSTGSIGARGCRTRYATYTLAFTIATSNQGRYWMKRIQLRSPRAKPGRVSPAERDLSRSCPRQRTRETAMTPISRYLSSSRPERMIQKAIRSVN